jgi:uncharacterized protein (DUF488 family)
MDTLWTIGHSTRPIEEFVVILRAYDITLVADVRSIPRSRRHPQYEQANLPGTLEAAGIEYRWFKDLGGRRHTSKDSPNTGWRNASFRGYADYMGTPQFAAALDELKSLAHKQKAAIMCAEAVPWRCHRSLIGDALVVQDWRVLDIFDEKTAKEHRLNPMAKVENGILRYPLTTHQEPLL